MNSTSLVRIAVLAAYLIPNSTWLVTSRLDTTRQNANVRCVERVETSVSSRAVQQARRSQKIAKTTVKAFKVKIRLVGFAKDYYNR